MQFKGEQKIVYGIDLGTTNSCLSKFVARKVSMVELDGGLTVPSIVSHDNGQFLVGKKALHLSKMNPELAIRSVKRFMGTPRLPLFFGGISLTPVEVSAQILSYLKSSALEQHGLVVQDVVITVPAYFNDIERRATWEAGQLAGLNVLHIINEPTAAALVHGHEDDGGEIARAEKWLVYDLGGGTFDVTLLSVRGNIKEVLSSSGNVTLGGDDFDDKIKTALSSSLFEQKQLQDGADKLIMGRLRHLAEDIKIRLSTEAEVPLLEVFAGRDGAPPRRLAGNFTRELLENLIQDDIDATIEKVRQVLYEANTKPTEIDKLLLVGGSTRIPLVRERLWKELALCPEQQVDPDLSVALGAGLYAAMSSGLAFDRIMVDVSSHTLGIACLGEEDYCKGPDLDAAKISDEDLSFLERLQAGHPKTFAPLIKRNTKLPARFEEIFYTASNNQSEVEVPVYQGNSNKVRENFFIGSFFARLSPCPENTPIKVAFTYDLNGIVKVAVTQRGESHNVQSFRMDLNAGPELNLDSSVFRHSGQEEAMEDEDRMDLRGSEVAGAITNQLIQKVRERLNQSSADSLAQEVSGLLDDYTKELMIDNGDEDKLDRIEGALYGWLEQG